MPVAVWCFEDYNGVFHGVNLPPGTNKLHSSDLVQRRLQDCVRDLTCSWLRMESEKNLRKKTKTSNSTRTLKALHFDIFNFTYLIFSTCVWICIVLFKMCIRYFLLFQQNLLLSVYFFSASICFPGVRRSFVLFHNSIYLSSYYPIIIIIITFI